MQFLTTSKPCRDFKKKGRYDFLYEADCENLYWPDDSDLDKCSDTTTTAHNEITSVAAKQVIPDNK